MGTGPCRGYPSKGCGECERCLETSTSLHQRLLGAPGLLSGNNPRAKDKGRRLEWDPASVVPFLPSPSVPYWECELQEQARTRLCLHALKCQLGSLSSSDTLPSGTHLFSHLPKTPYCRSSPTLLTLGTCAHYIFSSPINTAVGVEDSCFQIRKGKLGTEGLGLIQECAWEKTKPQNTPFPRMKVISCLSFFNGRSQKDDQGWWLVTVPSTGKGWRGLGMLTGLILCKGDNMWIVVVDEAWESTCLPPAHADLTVLPLPGLWVLAERHQSPAKKDKL